MPNLEPPTTPTPLTIDFEPLGRRVNARRGDTLLAAAQQAGIELVALCGGAGLCLSCKVQLMSGQLSPLTLDEQDNLSSEEIESGTRLACQAQPLGNVKINIPPESLTTPQRLQVECVGVSSALGEPVIQLVDVNMAEPTLEDQRSDEQRLKQAVSHTLGQGIGIETTLLGELSNLLRANNWHAGAALYNGRVTAILPLNSHPLGIAVDVGTTKVAMYLLDLQSGAILAKKGMMNPQISFGEDVISRIAYTENEADGRHTLQTRLVDTLNQMTADLCAEAGTIPGQVAAAVVVGNTVMHHLFAGLPVKQLALVPFVPAVSEPLDLPAASLGWHLAQGAQVYLPANIAGYVGADHVSMALATGIYQSKETMLALDIGTNTEISLMHNGHMRCCSCASGPAFEGAHIRFGMRASDGAIERVQIKDGKVQFHTIGNQPPIGLCGSGILDAVAQLRKNGMMKNSGQLIAGMPGVVDKDFILVDRLHSGNGEEITVHRRDINEIALAKGAIRTGIDILLRAAGLKADDIQQFVIAGAFGTYLDIESAVAIRMFPDLPRKRFSQVGNAAGLGAQMMLVSAADRAAARDFARRMEYVELTSQPDFQDVFVSSLYF